MREWAWLILISLALSELAWSGPRSTDAKRKLQSLEAQETESPAGGAKDLALEWHANAQVWALNDTSVPSAWFQFRVRRLELIAQADIAQKAQFYLLIDPAKALAVDALGAVDPVGDNSILQDAYVSIGIVPRLKVTLGQFFIRTMNEHLILVRDRLFPELSIVNRFYGDRREPGVMFSYTGEKWSTDLMASNGRGPGNFDGSNSKDLSLRVNHTFCKHLAAGAFLSLQDLSFLRNHFWGANLEVSTDPWTGRIEIAMGEQAGTFGYGGVLEAGYRINPRLQPITRFELMVPDRDSSLSSDMFSLGLNYYLWGNNAKVQFVGSTINGLRGNRGTPLTDPGKPRATLFLLSFIAGL